MATEDAETDRKEEENETANPNMKLSSDDDVRKQEYPEDPAPRSTMSSQKSKPWRQSTLGPVLAEYMPNDDPQPKPKPKPTKSKTQPAKKKERVVRKSPEPDDDVDDERQKARRERNLQVLREVEMVRDCYYRMYMDKLRSKVESQREEIRKNSERLERKLQAREERERQESRRVKKRLDKHTLEHNADFVLSVPKSDHYKILALQNKLKSQGMLRNQEEKDQFWADVRKPAILRKYLEIYKPLPLEPAKPPSSVRRQTSYSQSASHHDTPSRSRTSSQSERAAADPDFRPMTQIEETREDPSRPATREPTGLSARGGGEGQARPSDTVRKRDLDPSAIARAAAADLDRRFPQMELPPMSCFSVDVSEAPPDPDEVFDEMAAERRSKERRLFVKRLRRMYHLSQSNGATAQRILHGQEAKDDMEDLYNLAIGDVIAVDDLTRTIDEALGHRPAPPSAPPTDPRPWTKHLRSVVAVTTPADAEGRSESRSGSRRHSRGTSAGSQSSEPPRPTPPAPLSLDLLRQDTKIMEAKCLSTNWTNYLGVGTSKFSTMEA